MGVARVWPSLRLAGRGVEQQLLAAALESAASGHPCAVVVHGEAGVGKTRLVRDVCTGLGDEAQVLWGTCVHFGEASVPFAPVIGALQGWLAQTDAAIRAEVLSGAGELGTLLPALGNERSSEPGRLLPLIDLVFNRLAGRATTVLVVDDLQWADRTSLDVLAYLISGFREQRLGFVATCRDEHRGEGHPLHGWLADMRRLPGFTEVHLDRLDLAATEAQIEGLRGDAMDIGLAVQVQARSGGNPYLTELLVRGLTGDEQALPATAPAALEEALLASWHGLTAEARQATRVLAVGGRPTELALLEAVASEHGVAAARLPGCLSQAHDQGVIQPDVEGRQWFRHPLLAEVLYDAMPPGDTARIHATFVRVLESSPGGIPAGAVAELAVHNYRAGRIDETYRWSMTAADHAAELRAAAEEAIHLERACSLWDRVSPEVRGSPGGRVDLLRRASSVCGRVGRHDSAVALAEQALALVDRDSEPLLASTLLVAWSKVTHEQTVLGKTVAGEFVEAVWLTEAFPDSAEHALALAALAFAEHWDGLNDESTSHAEQAVQAARRSGSELALAGALSIRACAHLEDYAANPLADAQEAERFARLCGSTEWLENAAIWQVHCLATLGRTVEATAVARGVFEEVVADGWEFGYLLASHAAGGLLWLGQWDDCRDLLRTALAARCGGIAGAGVRLAAARLAAGCGRVAEAELHLERAMELVSADYAGLYADTTIATAEVLLAAGKPHEAMEWLHSRIVRSPAANPVYGEDSLTVFARAAAESAQAARDAGDDRGATQAIAMFDDLIDRWPAEPFTTPRPDVGGQAMAKAVYDAEVARCRTEPNQAELWRQAIDTCHAAGAPWHEAVSRLRCAEALLAAGTPTTAVSDLLRQAHRTAVELGARPLQEEVESLARIARVALREPVPIADTPRVPAALAGLTRREREILTFLVAGRSNAEIAKELVISGKTVSVHVSNILRKTGTSSRVEVATLAERLGTGRAD
ncbi:AAA family ATPase [Kribbella sp. NPDC050281]|uniref:helix-turn-helix transcriptional regulator n=1 Tax=Kribbella sp. NPDC050281 TaxID=3155515 RepID=UPI0034101474